MERAIANAVAQLREAIFDLHPPLLEHGGLAAALQELAAEISQRHDIRVSLEVAPDAPGAHDRLVFSVCRELLRNTARHAEASEARVRAWREAGELLLEVEDDGVGLTRARQEEALRKGHVGLALSAERVEALGGTFSVGAGTRGGTRVQAVLPARRRTDRTSAALVAAPDSSQPPAGHGERRSVGA